MGFKHEQSAGFRGDGNGWQYQVGSLSLAGLSGDQTLSATDYQKPIWLLTGAVTATTNLVVPNTIGQTWSVSNLATGGTITVKTASGSAVTLPTGFSLVTVSASNTITLIGAVDVKKTIVLTDATNTLTISDVAKFMVLNGTALTATRVVNLPNANLGIIRIKNTSALQTCTLTVGASTLALAGATSKWVLISVGSIEEI